MQINLEGCFDPFTNDTNEEINKKGPNTRKQNAQINCTGSIIALLYILEANSMIEK